MARLYSDPKKDPRLTTGGTTSNGFSDYLTKVATLIPGEIIAGYLMLLGFATIFKNPGIQIVGIWVSFAIGLILTPVYLNKMAEQDQPKKMHLILSSIAFIFWAYATTGETLSGTIAQDIYDPAISSFLLVAFSLVSGQVPLNK